MDWKSILGAVVPTVATALGGPFAGLAVEAVGKALGMSDATQDKIKKAIEQGQLTSDQIVALRNAEDALKVRLRELNIQEEELSFKDTADARAMQTANKSRVPAVLTFVVTVGFLAILVFMMLGVLKVDSSPPLLMLLGALGTAWGSVMQFWFGTTHDSGRKSDVIANIAQQP
jgi:hypothetical protein